MPNVKNYICDDDAVKEVGWIWATEVWEDVTLPANLLRKAQARLPELSKGIVSMELTIVDESGAGADIDYLNPANNTITIGASGVRLTM